MAILDPRIIFAPYEYPQAIEFWEKQQQAHWLPKEVSMAGDIQDWKTVLTEAEKNLVAQTLKGFSQAEILIEDYWATKVSRWFKKPEIQMMAITFGSFESLHAIAYAYLNQSLDLEDYAAFLHEPSAKAKIDRLMMTKGKSKTDIVRSLAVFSALNEGVSLFSSFAILLNFSRFNKLKGVGQIIAWSCRDEALHSHAGCWLLNQFVQEYPEVYTDEVKKDIYNAAELTVQLEDNFIDKAFELGDVEGLTKDDVKNFIRHRTNLKLEEIGLNPIYTDIDEQSLHNMEWFGVLTGGVEHQDFFATRPSAYSKGTHNWEGIFNELT